MEIRKFNIDGKMIIVKSRKSAVFLEEETLDDSRISFTIKSMEHIRELYEYLKEIAPKCWNDIVPKEAINMRSDYSEYYDRELDNNGYISINKDGIRLDKCMYQHERFYKFNKPKMQSFLYDLGKLFEEIN